MWLLLAFISAGLLGLYDTSKKTALKDNAVLPVLFLNTLFSTIIFSPFILDSISGAGWFAGTVLDNAPFANAWFARTALNYALLYHVKEWMSPGSLRRMERRMRKQQRREFFLPPSSVIARGGGFR